MTSFEKILELVAETTVTVRVLKEDYENVISELTGKSKEETESRLSMLFAFHIEKMKLEMKDIRDFGDLGHTS